MTDIVRIGGLTLRFLQTKEATDASLDLFEMTLLPDARMPVPHYHESWDETVYGLSGTTQWTIDGRAHEIAPGQSAFIRRGVVHSFRNQSGASATCLCVLTPGTLSPDYFREVAALVAGGPPDPQVMQAIMRRHGLVPVAPV